MVGLPLRHLESSRGAAPPPASPSAQCQGAVGLLLLLLQLGRGQREPPPLHRRWTGQPSPSGTRSPALSGTRGEAPRAMLGVKVTLLKSLQPSGRLAPGLLEDQEPGGEHGRWDREPFAVQIRPEGLQHQDHSQHPYSPDHMEAQPRSGSGCLRRDRADLNSTSNSTAS